MTLYRADAYEAAGNLAVLRAAGTNLQPLWQGFESLPTCAWLSNLPSWSLYPRASRTNHEHGTHVECQRR